MAEFSLLSIYVAVSMSAVVIALYYWFGKHSLRAIPTVGGSSLPFLSYTGSLKYVDNARALLQEGYDKYKGKVFKIPMPDRWLVVVTGTRLVDELQKLPDDYASFSIGVGELINTRYIFGDSFNKDPYHIAIIQKQLTRNISNMFEALHDETCSAVEDTIPNNTHGKRKSTIHWVAVPALATMENLIARISSRVFVGPQYCRNRDYLHLAVNFARDVSKARRFVGMFPPFLKRYAAKFVTDINPFVRRGIKLLGPAIMDRCNNVALYGSDYTDKPVDVLQWVVEAAVARGQGPEEIMEMMLLMNFASIFTTSTSLTHALLHLAAEPAYVQMLREEVEQIVEAEGWSKGSMNKMRKLDSFLRESQRYNGTNLVSITRMILKDFKFSDGTFLPAGTLAVAPVASTHRDAENYEDSANFDPLRFVKLRNEDGNGGVKYQFVATSVEYLSFGHGKHACPGRFFASSELKGIVAHLVLNYDMKLEREGVRPRNWDNAFVVVPSPLAKILFRKRSNT
ncbi:cytochrome P450 [Irpex rosettiformis]|uniref:Cytochrome P450 n=1 Tax=Irpex rosettiformis TaxID=378272 RepID=A0ACB8UKW6_9APHY|nr:cytochrome P450 [Irpex rosettiformis]